MGTGVGIGVGTGEITKESLTQPWSRPANNRTSESAGWSRTRRRKAARKRVFIAYMFKDVCKSMFTPNSVVSLKRGIFQCLFFLFFFTGGAGALVLTPSSIPIAS